MTGTTENFQNSDCGTNDWLYETLDYMWTMNEASSSLAYYIGSGCPTKASSTTGGNYCPQPENGFAYCPRCKTISEDYSNFRDVKAGDKSNDALVFPAAYLKPTVKIVSGTGSQEDPFVLSL